MMMHFVNEDRTLISLTLLETLNYKHFVQCHCFCVPFSY